MLRIPTGVALFASLLPIMMTAPVLAHHGQDFLITQSSHIPEAGEIYVIARQDYKNEGQEREIEFEPALIGSVTDWLLLDAHSHIEKVNGEHAEYESTAVLAQFRLTPRQQPWALGASVEYELASDNHEQDVWAFAGIASYEADGWIASINLLAERETGASSETEWGYAAGVRKSLSDNVAIGLEVGGSLEQNKTGEVLAGLFTKLHPSLSLNAGFGFGFNGGSDFSIRTALIFHLK